MEVLVVTRLCIGYQRPEIFEYRLSLLEHTAAKSMAVQTDKDFQWVIATDRRAPEGVADRLAAIGSYVRVVFRDPLLTGISPLDGKGVKELAPGRVALARLDDDDMLRDDFIASTKKIADSLPHNSAITWGPGFNLYEGGVEAAYYPWSGQGTTTVTTADDLFNPYTTPHMRLGEAAVKRGGKAFVGEEPMWVRTWHAASDSTSAKGFRFEQLGGEADLSRFGIDDHQAVYSIPKPFNVKPPIIDGRIQATSDVKKTLFSLIYQLRKDARRPGANVKLIRLQIARLSSALYSA